MQKLPEVTDRKNGWRMRKEKGTSWQEEAHSLSGSDRRSDNTLLTGGRHHTFVFGHIFKHLDWGIQPFQLYSGKIPHPLNGCWTQEIKEKYDCIKERSLSPICCCLLSYNSFLAFLIPGDASTRQRGVN